MYIKHMRLDGTPHSGYLQKLPAVRSLQRDGGMRFCSDVTFFVGENGTGKSTLLEGLAVACGFNAEGGTRNFSFATAETHSELGTLLTITKQGMPRDGFFLRAESFYNVASEVERLQKLDPVHPIYASYGGKSLHDQSHGESFMALVQHRFGEKGLFLLDEPEAALSPLRQMALLAHLHRLVQAGGQFIIATHSPILLAYPGACIYEFTEEGIAQTPYEQTEHYRITKQFLDAPRRMLAILLEEDAQEAPED